MGSLLCCIGLHVERPRWRCMGHARHLVAYRHLLLTGAVALDKSAWRYAPGTVQVRVARCVRCRRTRVVS
jgi:hypothetical protein